jgi:hypothetical protein
MEVALPLQQPMRQVNAIHRGESPTKIENGFNEGSGLAKME